MPRQNLVTTKSLFSITIIVTVLTILAIWLFGLGRHRTIFENSVLSTTVLSTAFFLFISIGLYRGIKLKDNVGKLTDRLKLRLPRMPEISDISIGGDFAAAGEGCGEVVAGIILWLIVSILIILFLWLFGVALWAGMIVFVAMLYWIFFRALRLVFKNSATCKGNLVRSISLGLVYTVFYNFWIYGIILGAHYLGK